MIIKKEKKNGITTYYVKKDYDDNKLSNIMNKKLKRNDIKNLIKNDVDVFTEDGKLLLRFRKNKLKKENVDKFYENVIDFAMTATSNRPAASGSKIIKMGEVQNMTNIIGYFDKLTPKQKLSIRNSGNKPLKITVRETRFFRDYSDKIPKLTPLIKEIDELYKKLLPDNYAKQKKKANQTPFHIADTSFTTVTTNVNYQTTVHFDKGDDDEGFGNLVVIENGKYKGGETCFPQYGIGVDVRTGDILYMDVHQPHANLPIELETKDAKRLSIVCYLRKSIWQQTKGKTKKFMIRHNKTLKRLLKPKNIK